jgi:hypothetical protein
MASCICLPRQSWMESTPTSAFKERAMERVGRGGRTTPPTDGRAEGGARARDVYADARAPEVEAVRSMGCVCLCLGRKEMCEEERENSLPRSLISSTRLSRGLRVCAPGARTQPGGTGDSPPPFNPAWC